MRLRDVNMKLKVGVWIPNFGSWTPMKDYSLDFDLLKELAQAADGHDFDCIWVSDHLINPAGAKPSGGPVEDRPIFEAWTTLSALSSLTTRVRLGNLVLCNSFRYPSLLAKMAATLDLISNGRFILNIGAGWFRREAIAYGIPWAKYSERLASLEEAIRVIKKLWQESEVNFRGEYFDLEKAILEPKPTQKPHPPIWIGGKSDNIMRLVAKEGNGWDIDIHENVLVSLKERVTSLRDYCLSIGRNSEEIEISTHAMAIPMRNREEAMKLALPHARAINKSVKEFADSHFIGSPKDIIEKLGKYKDVGLTNLCLIFGNGLEGIELFADEVIPET